MKNPVKELCDPTLMTAREIAARVWCDPEMSNYTMDQKACEQIARIIEKVRRRCPERACSLDEGLSAKLKEVSVHTAKI